jgi:DNA transformation protein
MLPMASSQEFADYIEELLGPLGNITVRRMFGGMLFKVEGKQLGMVISDTLYFKVTDKTLQKRYAKEGSKQFSYVRKDKKDPVIIKNWWSVPEDALEDGEALCELAREVLGQ